MDSRFLVKGLALFVFCINITLANTYTLQLEISRPNSCPVREDAATYTDILNKLKSIRDGLGTNCEKEAEAQIAKLNSDLSGLETIANDAAIGSDAESNAQVTQAFSTLGAIAAKSECYYNIRERGLFPVLADVLLDVSQVGLLLSNEDTIGYSTGGFFLGTTLKILISIFKQRFDFEDETDRKNFLNLNCAFFDVRKAIDKSGFLLGRSQTLITERDEIKEALPALEQTTKYTAKVLEDFIKDFEAKEKDYVDAQIGSQPLELESVLKTLKPQLDSEVTNNFEQRIILRNVASNVEKVLGLEFPYEIPSYSQIDFDAFKLTLESIKADYANLSAIDLEQFNMSVSQPVLYHTTWILEYIENIRTTSKEEFSKMIADVPTENQEEITWGDYYTKTKQSLESQAAQDLANFENSTARLGVLNSIINQERFSFTDPGDNERIDILETYSEIVKIIYGASGKNFLRYVQNESKDYIRRFNDAYEDFSDAFLGRGAELSPIVALRACQNADYLIKAYNNTAYYSEVGHDFLMTNIRIFHDYVPQSRRLIVVPVGKSAAATLQRESISMLYARAKLQGQEISPEEEDAFLSRRSFGKLMLRVISAQANYEQVQDYWISNNCENMFQ